MSKGNNPTNPILRGLIRKLRKKSKELEVSIWEDLAERLSRSNRARAEVNISQLNRDTEEGETIVVPGKVLGSGKLDHSISVAAFNFSNRAQKRIQTADGEVLSIEELLDKNPEGNNITIME